MRRYLAEGIGTFALVFSGCGAAAVASARLGDAGVALAFGLALAAMTAVTAPISGACLNPAVTVAMAVAGRLPRADVLPYCAAQLGGGAAGAGLVVAMAGGRPGGAPRVAEVMANGYGALSPGYYGMGAAAIAEVVLTAIVALVVLGVSPWSDGRARRAAGPTHGWAMLAGISGVAYALVHLVGRPVTGMSANPARSLGPAIFAGGAALEQVWLFVVAPIAGGVLAALAHRAMRAPGGEMEREAVSGARGSSAR